MVGVVAFVFAAVLTPCAIRIGTLAGAVDRPGDPLKIHARAIPVLGGVALLGAVLAALALAGRLPGGLVVLALVLAAAVGLADDIRPLALAPKLAGQASIALTLGAFAYLDLRFGLIAAAGLVVASLGAINAVNMIDGQDGLAGGLGALAAFGFFAAGSAHGSAALALAVGGALLGFLPWNWSPARVFLGDNGAYVVATALMAAAASQPGGASFRNLLVAALCLGVFVFEICVTVTRRLHSRRTVATGDRLHSYDLLSDGLGSRRRVTLLFWAVGGACAGGAFVVKTSPPVISAGLAVFAVAVGLALGRALWPRLPRWDA